MANGAKAASLIGTWELVSLSAQLPNGQTIEPWGHAPPGRIVYDANGYMMALIVGVLHDENGPDQEASRSDDRFTSYFGTYEIDQTTGEIVHQVTATSAGCRPRVSCAGASRSTMTSWSSASPGCSTG